MMAILSIESWQGNPDRGTVRVEAIVDDMRCVCPASRWEPEEWAPALCTAVVLAEPEDWPETETEQKQWLEDYGPEWTVEDTSDCF
jgi:hypothetical protein